MIMKKRTYIQPEMEVAMIAMSELMTPGGGSPTDGGMDPKLMPSWRPKNPTRTPVF